MHQLRIELKFHESSSSIPWLSFGVLFFETFPWEWALMAALIDPSCALKNSPNMLKMHNHNNLTKQLSIYIYIYIFGVFTLGRLIMASKDHNFSLFYEQWIFTKFKTHPWMIQGEDANSRFFLLKFYFHVIPYYTPYFI